MLVLMAAPAISPTISGLILSSMGFSWLFTLMLSFLAIALVGTLLFMDDALDRRNSNVDIASVVLSCLGFGGVVFGIGQAASYGFVHPLVIGPVVIGAAALAFYARRQLASEHPLLNLRILTYPRYRRSLALMCVLQLVLFGGVLIVPLFLLRGWGLSAMEAGLYMLPGGVLTAVDNLLAGMAYDRFGTKTVPFGLIGNAIVQASSRANTLFETQAMRFPPQSRIRSTLSRKASAKAKSAIEKELTTTLDAAADLIRSIFAVSDSCI
jgi:DHA2 family lincomycin resistance protein-like MFS transporter